VGSKLVQWRPSPRDPIWVGRKIWGFEDFLGEGLKNWERSDKHLGSSPNHAQLKVRASLKTFGGREALLWDAEQFK